MKKILVVQFRTKKIAAQAERDDILRVVNGTVDVTVINAVTDIVDWDAPACLLSGYHGVILGGSGDMHFDGGARSGEDAHDLMYAIATKLQKFLAYIVAHDIPTLGICLGHQLLAYAAGTSVRRCARQSKTGTFMVEKCCDASDPIFGNLPQTFAAQYGHKDSVSALPQGATLLVHSAQCDYGAVRYGKNVYSTQFHPEMDCDAMATRIAAHPEYLPDGAVINDLFEPSPHASQILANFVQFVVHRTA